MTSTETYEVTIDRNSCDGVFACLVRDPRFVEDEDGLASVDPESSTSLNSGSDAVVAEFDDDRRDEAEQAAEACPLDAICVEGISGEGSP